jgi:hypothetical protein
MPPTNMVRGRLVIYIHSLHCNVSRVSSNEEFCLFLPRNCIEGLFFFFDMSTRRRVRTCHFWPIT